MNEATAIEVLSAVAAIISKTDIVVNQCKYMIDGVEELAPRLVLDSGFAIVETGEKTPFVLNFIVTEYDGDGGYSEDIVRSVEIDSTDPEKIAKIVEGEVNAEYACIGEEY